MKTRQRTSLRPVPVSGCGCDPARYRARRLTPVRGPTGAGPTQAQSALRLGVLQKGMRSSGCSFRINTTGFAENRSADMRTRDAGAPSWHGTTARCETVRTEGGVRGKLRRAESRSPERMGHGASAPEAENKKATPKGGFFAGFLVGERGFEPPAPASRTQCSTRLSYSPNFTANCGAALCASSPVSNEARTILKLSLDCKLCEIEQTLQVFVGRQTVEFRDRQ